MKRRDLGGSVRQEGTTAPWMGQEGVPNFYVFSLTLMR